MKQSFTNPDIELDTIETLSAKLLATTAELSVANNALKEERRIRKEMLANISHDLRAPITAIRGALDLLIENANEARAFLNPETIEMHQDMYNLLNMIDRRTQNLESLINDMYYLFCVEDEQRSFNFEITDIAMFLETFFYDAIVDFRYNNHNMILDVDSSFSAKVNIDIQRMIRVLDNLFTNAAKYSGDGTEIKLSLLIKDDYAQICVSDNGIGIDKELIKHIFERTYTASSARTPMQNTDNLKSSGSGLGLAIVKTIIERHGGSISCISDVGYGCKFIFTLPIVR